MNLKLPKIFYSKLFLIACMIALAVTGYFQYNEWRERQAIDKEIAQLQAKQQELETTNTKLTESLQYFQSASYQDKSAREQLGLQKPGEITFNFPKSSQSAEPSEPQADKGEPNWKKWWKFLFVNN